MKRYVCGFMFSPDRQLVALIDKLKPAWQRGRLNGIGGKIESNELPFEAMVREFYEETGVRTVKTDWSEVVYYANPGAYEVHFFKAFSTGVFNVETRSSDEGTISLYRTNPIPPKVIFNLNWLIPLCLDSCLDPRPIRVTEAVMEAQS